jgi:hypothetical protein
MAAAPMPSRNSTMNKNHPAQDRPRQRQNQARVLPAAAGRTPFPQPHHHGMQVAETSAVQDQAAVRHRSPRTRHIDRLYRYQARQPVRQLHLQMRHPVHVPERVGPKPAPVQRMRHRRDHNLARQQGTEPS